MRRSQPRLRPTVDGDLPVEGKNFNLKRVLEKPLARGLTLLAFEDSCAAPCRTRCMRRSGRRLPPSRSGATTRGTKSGRQKWREGFSLSRGVAFVWFAEATAAFDPKEARALSGRLLLGCLRSGRASASGRFRRVFGSAGCCSRRCRRSIAAQSPSESGIALTSVLKRKTFKRQSSCKALGVAFLRRDWGHCFSRPLLGVKQESVPSVGGGTLFLPSALLLALKRRVAAVEFADLHSCGRHSDGWCRLQQGLLSGFDSRGRQSQTLSLSREKPRLVEVAASASADAPSRVAAHTDSTVRFFVLRLAD